MKVAIVASSYLPRWGGLERHVDRLAKGLAYRGAEVELLVHGRSRGDDLLPGLDSVTIRRFAADIGPWRLGVAPAMWKRLRLLAGSCDVVDVHTTQLPLALAVARAGFRRLVLTLHAPLPRLLAWPYAPAAAYVIDSADHIWCDSGAERDVLCRTFAGARHMTEALRPAVDTVAIGAARPFEVPGCVVLAVGKLDRARRVERAIAAMPSLNASFRLVIVGDGPARNRLEAYAQDLQVAGRVSFTGSAADPDLYRWLQTAWVVLALAPADSSGLQVIEALAAGARVVASDIPVHHEVAASIGSGDVRFVSPEGSPLEVADAITQARADDASTSVVDPHTPFPSWEHLIDRTWSVYERLTASGELPAVPRAPLAPGARAEIDARVQDGWA